MASRRISHTWFFEPPELRTHADALTYLCGEYAAMLRALVDVLVGGGKLEGEYLEDLANLVEALAAFLREPEPSPIRFEASQSLEYVEELTEAVRAVGRNGSAEPESLLLLDRVLTRAIELRAEDRAARRA